MSTEPVRLKSWPAFFKAIKAGQKLHDLRDMRDRQFFVGQRLILEEYDPFMGRYSGDKVTVEVTYITANTTPCALSSAVLDRGFCILSIRVVTDEIDRAALIREAMYRRPTPPAVEDSGILPNRPINPMDPAEMLRRH